MQQPPLDARPSFIERGSTVRVRQRALEERKSPEIVDFVVWRSTTEHLCISVGTAIELAARPRRAGKPNYCPAPRSPSLVGRGSTVWPWPESIETPAQDSTLA